MLSLPPDCPTTNTTTTTLKNPKYLGITKTIMKFHNKYAKTAEKKEATKIYVYKDYCSLVITLGANIIRRILLLDYYLPNNILDT